MEVLFLNHTALRIFCLSIFTSTVDTLCAFLYSNARAFPAYKYFYKYLSGCVWYFCVCVRVPGIFFRFRFFPGSFSGPLVREIMCDVCPLRTIYMCPNIIFIFLILLVFFWASHVLICRLEGFAGRILWSQILGNFLGCSSK